MESEVIEGFQQEGNGLRMYDQVNKSRPSKRAAAQEIGECRITRVRYVALGVADLSSSLGFYRDEWGLSEEAVDGDSAYLAAVGSTDPFALRLRSVDENRLDLFSFAVPNREDVDWYAQKLARVGVEILTEPGTLSTLGGGYGFRFMEPIEGRTIEISADVTPRMAREVGPREHLPVGISHMVINSARMDELVEFFHRHLGFYKSDYLADRMVFLKGNSVDHHAFAIARNDFANLNHVAYETRGIDEYMRAAGQLLRKGHDMVWGPGRHGPGDNTFAYFQDPNGYVAEYTTALEPIEDVSVWEPRIWDPVPDQSDQWGTACVRNPKPFVGLQDPGLWTPPPV